MSTHRRSAIARVSRAAAACTAALALAACADDGGAPPAPLADFVLTAPDGFAELVPTTTTTLAWEVTASPALGLQLDALTGAEPPVLIGRRALAAGTLAWDGRDPAGGPARPGNYRIRATALGPDDGTVDTAEGDNAHLVVVQGVRFAAAMLAFTGAQPARDLVLTSTTRSTMELTLLLDPDVANAGDELPLLTATIPGELVPTGRSYPFTGRTADGQAIAAGAYVLAASIKARAGTITYRTDGPTLTWAP